MNTEVRLVFFTSLEVSLNGELDPTFIKHFLMTFKSFMTLDELFDLLEKRFWIQPPDNLSEDELVEWTKLKQHVIRMR